MPDVDVADGQADPDDLLDVVQRAIRRLGQHADPTVRAETEALLAGIDAVHRTALSKLVDLLQSMGGDALMTRLVAEPAIRLLFMSYDVIAVDRRLMAEEALDDVRGHLHANGIDVELIDVAGGVVYVQFHGAGRAGASEPLLRQDVERALREGLRGFQQLEVGARQPTPSGGTVFVPLAGLRRMNRPVLQTVARASDVASGQLIGLTAEGRAILVANVGGQFFAVQDHCGDGPLPLRFSALEAHVLTCSWHGCRYDVRTGHRLDRPGAGLTVYPVSVADGDVRVAVAVTPVGEPM